MILSILWCKTRRLAISVSLFFTKFAYTLHRDIPVRLMWNILWFLQHATCEIHLTTPLSGKFILKPRYYLTSTYWPFGRLHTRQVMKVYVKVLTCHTNGLHLVPDGGDVHAWGSWVCRDAGPRGSTLVVCGRGNNPYTSPLNKSPQETYCPSMLVQDNLNLQLISAL